MRLFSLLHRSLLLPAILLSGTAVAQSDYGAPYAFKTVSGLPALGSIDGAATSAHFNRAAAVAVDSHGNTFVADTGNNTIRKISTNGTVSTFAGVAGIAGSVDGTGTAVATAARFFSPGGLAIDRSTDTLYVADTGNHTIRRITSDGSVTTLAGAAGTIGFANGTGSNARFDLPYGLTVDASHNVYVTDTGNNIVRMVTPAGVVSTVAGVGMIPSTGSTDATAPTPASTCPTAQSWTAQETSMSPTRAITRSGR